MIVIDGKSGNQGTQFLLPFQPKSGSRRKKNTSLNYSASMLHIVWKLRPSTTHQTNDKGTFQSFCNLPRWMIIITNTLHIAQPPTSVVPSGLFGEYLKSRRGGSWSMMVFSQNKCRAAHKQMCLSFVWNLIWICRFPFWWNPFPQWVHVNFFSLHHHELGCASLSLML